MHVILAGGPYLNPATLLLLLTLLACPVLALGLFIYAIVLFSRRKIAPGSTCVLLSFLFLIPLWFGQKDPFYNVMIAFAVVFAIAFPLWTCFVVRKR